MKDNEILQELRATKKWFTKHGWNTNTAIVGICDRAIALIEGLQTDVSDLKEKNEKYTRIIKLQDVLIKKTENTIRIAENALMAQEKKIEGLKSRIDALNDTNWILMDSEDKIKTLAIMEFAARAKEYSVYANFPLGDAAGSWVRSTGVVTVEQIDRIANEMVGGSDA